MALSSAPAASLTPMVGASATPVTATFSVEVVVAVSPSASVDVAVTVSAKSSLESAGGVTVRSLNWSGVRVQEPSPLSVPALRLAPSGTPLIVSDNVSDPSVSVSADEISSVMALSSAPAASLTSIVGASATPVSETFKIDSVEAVLPLDSSVDVTVTVREKSSLESAGGVTVRSVN